MKTIFVDDLYVEKRWVRIKTEMTATGQVYVRRGRFNELRAIPFSHGPGTLAAVGRASWVPYETYRRLRNG